jgi:hypothetical protein
MTMKRALATAVCAHLLASASTTMAAADHLKCYKAREVEGPGRLTATANLVSGIGLATENGCLIRGPSRLLCAPVEKLGLPPGGGPTGATTKFVCYKLKCPKQALQNVTAKDQFGTHVFVLRFPTTFCAPASPSGAFLEASPVF